jgi:hypothetical protein
VLQGMPYLIADVFGQHAVKMLLNDLSPLLPIASAA